jgi:hypothetical protein
VSPSIGRESCRNRQPDRSPKEDHCSRIVLTTTHGQLSILLVDSQEIRSLHQKIAATIVTLLGVAAAADATLAAHQGL